MTNDDILILRLIRDLETAGRRLKAYNDLVWAIRDSVHLKVITDFDPTKPPEPVAIELVNITKHDYEAYQKIKELIRNFN